MSSVQGMGLCNAGAACPAGSAAAAGSGPCPGGFYCAPGADLQQCPLGSFCPASSTAARPCSPGAFCANPGLSAVSGNWYAVVLSGVCARVCLCAHGWPDLVVFWACCLLLTLLMFFSKFIAIYPFLRLHPVRTRIRSSAGSYCPIGSQQPTAYICAAGFYCPAGSSASTGAGQCRAGYYCSVGSVSATQAICSPGFYCSAGSAVNSGTGQCQVWRCVAVLLRLV